MDPPPSSTSTNVLAVAVASEGGLALLALALGWFFNLPAAEHLHWTGTAVAQGILASLPLAVVLVALTRFPIGPLASLQRVMTDFVVPLFAECSWLDFAVIAILAGFGEELLFRGVLQVGLAKWLSPALALVLVSVLFGLAHPLTLGYAVLAGVFGLYLGALFQWTDNLLVAIVAHAVYDFLALAYLVRRS